MNYDYLYKKYGLVRGLVTQNSDGENVIVTIDEESACLRTFQHNDWIRTNIYYPDGTSEELYEK